MPKMIFVSLPVKELAASEAFYTALGFTKNPAFSDAGGSCMVWSEHIYVMLLSHAKWQGFTTRPICPKGSSEVGLSLNCDSRADVDAMLATAAQHGGVIDGNPPQDHGFMYQRTIFDLDDHVWEPFWFDPAAMPPAQS